MSSSGHALELAAGGVDVAPTRAADECRHSAGHQNPLKILHLLVRGRGEGNVGAGIERNQVDLGAQAVHQVEQFTRVLWLVVLTRQQDILKREALARTQRKLTRGGEQLLQVPLAI